MAEDDNDAVTSTAAAQDNPEEGEETADADEELYVVEEILAKRVKNNVLEYKVKWEGYDLSEATWQTGDDLTNCAAVIEQFETKLKEEKREKRRKIGLSQPPLATRNDIPSESGSSIPPDAKVLSQSIVSSPSALQNIEPQQPTSSQSQCAINNPLVTVLDGHRLSPSASQKLSVTQKRKRPSGLLEANEVSQPHLNGSISHSQKKVQSEKRQKIQAIHIFNSNERQPPPSSSPEITPASHAGRSELAKTMAPVTLSIRKKPPSLPKSARAPSTSFESPTLVAALQRSKYGDPRTQTEVNQVIYEFTDEERQILELRRLAPKVITCLGMVKNAGEEFPRVVMGFSGENGGANFSKTFLLSVVREILPTKLLDFYESCIHFE
ncbi:hypothetical protein RvY_05641 [Ramazzottius varieornatus]|uniref:Chromo domain-containing protein n=1 Tax=Ramazzottius varieornatus TaxID=947166 RepID=A0A1D1UYT2_RAMVA|nr:hypothetical protein RvY_05641 [Ramazzottius varieornatus]